MFNYKNYSLGKSKKILFHVLKWFNRKEKVLSEIEKNELISSMKKLEQSIMKKDKVLSSNNAKELEKLSEQYIKKSFLEKTIDSSLTLVIALFIAILVRQMWFENYTIPSGSMRPTLKEKDFLIVSKTNFSINKPTSTGDFYFNKKLINRGDIIVFSTADMDVRDSNYMYFFIIPGKKQFIKRLIAKPGDTLYFYGGQIYGVDKNGNEITEYQKNKWFSNIEHIPFIRFEGNQILPENSSYGLYNNVIITQMNTPVAQLKSSPAGNTGKLLTNVHAPFSSDFSAKKYFDIWGYKNYAMARIITKSQAISFNLLNYNSPQKADYYLELTHHPSLENIKLEKDYLGRLVPTLSKSKSIITLDNYHLSHIFSSLYTCRFNVNSGIITKAGYGANKNATSFSPRIKNIPDGDYEFQNGIAYSINFAGITKKLPSSHPIYKMDNKNIVTLYNLGIEMHTLFTPKENNQQLTPSRYAYFRDGDLYLMGHPIFRETDEQLIDFISSEKTKRNPFIDNKPPLLTNGTVNKEIIFKYGLKIPDDQYLMLGDNHAMSSDSRDFGFVPEKNLRGKASFIYWPPQNRMGSIPQPSSKWISLPKITILLLAFIISITCFLYYRKKHSLPIKFK